MFITNIILTLVTVWLLMYINNKYLLPLRFNEDRFKLFALRDSLAILAMKDKIPIESPEYLTLNYILNISIKSLSDFSLVNFLNTIYNLNTNKQIEEEIDSIISNLKVDNTEYLRILNEYFNVMKLTLEKQTRVLRYILFPLMFVVFGLLKLISIKKPYNMVRYRDIYNKMDNYYKEKIQSYHIYVLFKDNMYLGTGDEKPRINRKAYNLIKGAGSILDIYPSTDYTKYLPERNTKTDAENLRSDWERIGQDMYKAMGLYKGKKHEE